MNNKRIAKTKVRYKTVNLYPTPWKLDAYIVDEPYRGNEVTEHPRQVLSEFFNKRYGAEQSYYHQELERINSVMTINSTGQSELKGEQRIVMIINPMIDILVHEIVHVVFHLSKHSGVDVNYDSQEWVACMTEYIFAEVKDFSKFPTL